MRVLVVDDRPDTTGSMALYLGLHGHEVRAAEGGPQALAGLADWRPDAVIVDQVMPGMDGVQVIRRLRQDPSLASVPVALVSGLSLEDAERSVLPAARQLGGVSYFQKPVDPALWLSWLDGLLAKAGV